MKLITIILSILFFNGCASKIVYQKELICIEQKTVERPKVKLRIIKEDKDIAQAFKDTLDLAFEFYESQVKRNNNLCEVEK